MLSGAGRYQVVNASQVQTTDARVRKLMEDKGRRAFQTNMQKKRLT